MIAVLNHLAFAAFPLAMAYVAASDLFTMTISNRVSVVLVALFAASAVMIGMDLPTLGMHLAAAAMVLVIAFACFAFGWIGGGDAKIAAVIALWLGMGNMVEFLGMSAIFGGGLTLLILSFRSAALPALIVRQPWIARLHRANEGVPYGIALAGAAMMIYPESIWMKLLLG